MSRRRRPLSAPSRSPAALRLAVIEQAPRPDRRRLTRFLRLLSLELLGDLIGLEFRGFFSGFGGLSASSLFKALAT